MCFLPPPQKFPKGITASDLLKRLGMGRGGREVFQKVPR